MKIMKALFITTESNEMPQYVETWTCLGRPAERFAFNHVKGRGVGGDELDFRTWTAFKASSPDLVVYIGACESLAPSAMLFREIKGTTPTVLLCPDAGDEPWYKDLEFFDKHQSFSLMVGMDGCKTPLASMLITLMAFNPDRFTLAPHADRPTLFGFAGDPGTPDTIREKELSSMKSLIKLKIRPRDKADYGEVTKFISSCRIIPNVPHTGTFKSMQVKWRVMEAGWAGCLLLEMAGSPTKDWFTPGEDYLEWTDAAHASVIVAALADRPEYTQKIGMNLRGKLLAEYTPNKLWERILKRI